MHEAEAGRDRHAAERREDDERRPPAERDERQRGAGGQGREEGGRTRVRARSAGSGRPASPSLACCITCA
jgi:hypothetical protein